MMELSDRQGLIQSSTNHTVGILFADDGMALGGLKSLCKKAGD